MGLLSTLIPSGAKVVKGGFGLLGKAPSVYRKAAVGVIATGASLAAADVIIAPAAEAVTGWDIPYLGEGRTGDALTEIARQVGDAIGGTQASYIRGTSEGLIQGFLPGTSEGDAKTFVTIAILGIGAFLLISLVKK